MTPRRSWTTDLVVALLGVLLFTQPALAQDADDFDDMSLEDLLNTEVVTASKNAENISDAPGIISTITAREIEQFGATSLLDVLERAPGFYAIGNSLLPQGMVSIRGDAATSINNHVLVLLDGRPMRESLSGGHNTPIYTAFPIESIDRLEIVRGPGSVLYGSNAYAGVINIITKQAKEGSTLTTRAGYGSFDARTFTAHGAYKEGELTISGGVRFHDERGQGEYTAFVPGEEPNTLVPVQQNVGQTFNLGEDVIGATLSARYKGLSFRSFAGFNNHGYYPGALGTDDDATVDFSHVTTDVAYEHALASWWDASLNTTFNYDRFALLGSAGQSHDVIVEATNYLRPFENANLVAGGLVYSLYGKNRGPDFMNPATPTPTIEYIEPYNALWWSAYTQFDMRPIDKVKLIAGGQINKVEGLDSDFVPRLGAIYNVTETMGAKLLYGQAFRSPYATERSIDIPAILKGNADLDPEKVTSLDAQLFYNAQQLQLAATYFNASQQNLIVEHSYMEPGAFFPITTYVNQGGLTIQGVELEAKGTPTDRLYFTGSLVYQNSEDDDGTWGTTLVPEVMGKAGVSYASRAGVTLGLFNTYFSAPRALTDFDPEAAESMWGTSERAEAFNYLTAKLTVNVTELMHLNNFPKMVLDFYGTNLLCGDVYVSDIEKSLLSVPRQEGRTFYGAFRVEL